MLERFGSGWKPAGWRGGEVALLKLYLR